MRGKEEDWDQAQIQDFEMGGEFSPPQSEKSEKSNNQILFQYQYLRDKKKKERRGLRKRGGG